MHDMTDYLQKRLYYKKSEKIISTEKWRDTRRHHLAKTTIISNIAIVIFSVKINSSFHFIQNRTR